MLKMLALKLQTSMQLHEEKWSFQKSYWRQDRISKYDKLMGVNQDLFIIQTFNNHKQNALFVDPGHGTDNEMPALQL